MLKVILWPSLKIPVITNDIQGHWKYSHHRKVVGTHFHACHGTKTIPLFLPADGEASWLLLPSLVSLLSGSTVQPENTYSYILNVTGQVWESQKRISINTNHSYHQLLSPSSQWGKTDPTGHQPSISVSYFTHISDFFFFSKKKISQKPL